MSGLAKAGFIGTGFEGGVVSLARECLTAEESPEVSVEVWLNRVCLECAEFGRI